MPSDGFKRFPAGTIPVAYIFLRNFYIFLSIFISHRIDSRCSLLSTWPGLAMQLCYIVKFIIIIIIIIIIIMLNLILFFFYVWNRMLCTKYIIVFSLENSFPIVLSGEV
jgi:hypothetical protein